MKKIIFIIFTLFLIIFLTGLFFSHKENVFKINRNTLETKSQINQTSTPQAFSIIDQSNLSFSLEIQRQINEDVYNLTENLKPDADKSISQYQKEIQQIQSKLDLNQQNIKPEILINIAKDLSLIQPPVLLYQFHLELIKTYYTLGVAFQQFQQTDDPIKKILLYNLIKDNLAKIKI